MFSRWNFARIKAVENALNEGRIDEAYVRLTRPETKNNPKAQRMHDNLASALLARARVHAQAGRYTEALADLDRLSEIGRFSNEAQTLRQRAEQELRCRIERHAAGGDAARKAADDIKAGRLETGQLALERLEDAQRRERLREELDVRVQRNEQLLLQARQSFERDDLLTACRFWEEACSQHGRTCESDSFGAELARTCADRLDKAFAAGRLEQLRTILAAAPTLLSLSPELARHRRLLDTICRAGELLIQSDYSALRDKLLRMQAAHADAAWLKAALTPLDEILSARTRLLASPLGTITASLHDSPNFKQATSPATRHNDETRPAATDAHGAAFRGNSLLLLIDGTGSALVTPRDLVRIGRAGSGRELEIPISADLHSHHADIIRDGDDYFLSARGPVRVNHKAVSRTLLRHGDRIVLSKSAKMTFHKPSSKSETAVLKFSSGCRLAQDVSLAVLFKGTCLAGPQASCHIQTREGDSRFVMFEKDGGLFFRRAARDGRPTGAAEPLAKNETCDVGDLRLTVKDYQIDGAGGSI